MLWLRLVLCCAILLSWGSAALAHSVALLRPAQQTPSTTELLERLRGELLSVGFEVTVRDRPESKSAGATETWPPSLAPGAEFDATVDVVGDSTFLAVDVWIKNDSGNFELLARIKPDPARENPAKGLAIRASEALRARLFETHMGNRESRPTPHAPAGEVPAAVDTKVSRPAGRWGFELGAAALTSLDGVGPAFLPLIRFDWMIESRVVLQATLAGFGTQPNVVAPEGNAQVAMQFGLLGACYRLDWRHPVKPLVALSMGALRTAVVAHADLPREGHSLNQWSFLADASLGAALQLSQHYAVSLAGHVQLAEPSVAIHFGDRTVASLGRPNLLATVTFGVWP